MLKINLICVGNLKDKEYISLSEEYLKRLQRFAKVSVVELKEKTCFQNTEQTVKAESEDILSELSDRQFVLLDKGGELMTSEELASFVENWFLSNSELNFVIGGSYGVDEKTKKKASKKLSFGKMTFPHRLARIMLLEQVYRAMTIINNISYHK